MRKLDFNIDECREVSSKYQNRTDLKKYSGTVYIYANKNGWLDEICSHMKFKQSPNGYWNNFERCKEVALLCKHKTEFQNKYQSAHKYAKKNDWLCEICSHMIPLGNKMKRLVYVYEFSDNTCYIGLTENKDDRFNEHMRKGPVFKHIEKSGLIPNYIILSDYIDVGDAQELEHVTKLKYIEEGWNVLNTAATGRGIGALGTSVKFWTKERCLVDALKYTSRSDFKKNSGGYKSARKNGWLDEICSHMEYIQLPNGYWIFEKCKEEALKYDFKIDFKNNNNKAYRACLRNGWLDEICSHMNRPISHKLKWTYINCKEEVIKYNTISEFQKNNTSAYHSCLKNKWLYEFFPKLIN